MYEKRRHPLLDRAAFRRRVAHHWSLASGLLGFALAIGTIGYHLVAGLGWVDALLNAAMILSGMGPVDPLPDDGAKIFASFYALFSGIVFLGMAGVIFAPLVHRMLHRFHLDDDDRRSS